MSKILLIEPHKIMQQAIVLSVFPEHDTEVTESFPESNAAQSKDFDVVIVDASALRDANKLGPQEVQAVQSWKIPTLWLEDGDSGRSPTREKLAVIKKPIELEALRSALAKFLNPQTTARRQNDNSVNREPGSKKAPAGENKSAAAPDAEEVIELVDVVEEDSERKKTKKQVKKSN